MAATFSTTSLSTLPRLPIVQLALNIGMKLIHAVKIKFFIKILYFLIKCHYQRI
jgi:hypothetical protein